MRRNASARLCDKFISALPWLSNGPGQKDHVLVRTSVDVPRKTFATPISNSSISEHAVTVRVPPLLTTSGDTSDRKR